MPLLLIQKILYACTKVKRLVVFGASNGRPTTTASANTNPKRLIGTSLVILVLMPIVWNILHMHILPAQRREANRRNRARVYDTPQAFIPPHATVAPVNVHTLDAPLPSADDCFHVFLDVGANRGVHGRFLYEPQQYPKNGRARQIFNEEFGTERDNRDFCVFAFEPNPTHHAYIQSIQDAYAAMGWRYYLIPKGVSDVDSTLVFYHQGDGPRQEWGFSTSPLAAQTADSMVEIPVVRLASFLEQVVLPRKLPTKVYGNYSRIVGKNGIPGPKVVMKMDIESAEYRVLPDLLISGTLCRTIDLLFGEVHSNPKFMPIQLGGNDHKIQSTNQAEQFWKAWITAWQANPWCSQQARYLNGDDESYLEDGVPLPTAPPLRATAKMNQTTTEPQVVRY